MRQLLIIDDDDEMCEELCDILKDEYDVVACESGEAGLRYLRAGGFDLVLLDLKLPGMSGYEVMTHIQEEHLPVKVVVLTGNPMNKRSIQNVTDRATEGHRAMILKKADGVINKPFEVETVLAKIDQFVPSRKTHPRFAE